MHSDISRVADQNGTSQACSIVEIYCSGLEPSVYESVWFRVGVMIDSNELCISILILLAFTSIQGQGGARNQKLLCQLSLGIFSVGGLWYTVEICQCDERPIHCVMFMQYSREETLQMWFWL